jgi:hypothetical protein
MSVQRFVCECSEQNQKSRSNPKAQQVASGFPCVHPHKRIVLSIKNERSPDPHYIVDKSQKCAK